MPGAGGNERPPKISADDGISLSFAAPLSDRMGEGGGIIGVLTKLKRGIDDNFD